MLKAFSEQTEGQKLPEDASDQQMLEIVMARYMISKRLFKGMPDLKHCSYNFISVSLSGLKSILCDFNIYWTELSSTFANAVILILSLWLISS